MIDDIVYVKTNIIWPDFGLHKIRNEDDYLELFLCMCNNHKRSFSKYHKYMRYQSRGTQNYAINAGFRSALHFMYALGFEWKFYEGLDPDKIPWLRFEWKETR